VGTWGGGWGWIFLINLWHRVDGQPAQSWPRSRCDGASFNGPGQWTVEAC
jgi:hypothetical protein